MWEETLAIKEPRIFWLTLGPVQQTTGDLLEGELITLAEKTTPKSQVASKGVVVLTPWYLRPDSATQNHRMVCIGKDLKVHLIATSLP